MLALHYLCELEFSRVVSTFSARPPVAAATAHHSTLGVGTPEATQTSDTEASGAAVTFGSGCSKMLGGALSGGGGKCVGAYGGGSSPGSKRARERL